MFSLVVEITSWKLAFLEDYKVIEGSTSYCLTVSPDLLQDPAFRRRSIH